MIVISLARSLHGRIRSWIENGSVTGKSLSEALTLESTNPQYDKRLFIDLPVQYMKTTSSEHDVYINCFECQNKKKQFMYTTCSELVVFMYWTGKSMNNLLSNCGLVDARIRTSNRDLPVQRQLKGHFWSVAKVALRFGWA